MVEASGRSSRAPEWLVEIGYAVPAETTIDPFIGYATRQYLPWINLLGAAQIAFNLFLLSRMAWQPSTRLAAITLKVGGIALAFAMLTGPALVAISSATVAGTPLAGVVDMMAPFLSLGIMIALMVAIVVTTIEVIQYTDELLTGGPLPRLAARK